MFNNPETNFFKTKDHEQIFFQKNFSVWDEKKLTLVFNYGLVCSNHHWKYQLEYFEKNGYQVLIHDYRGHFNSSGIQDIKKITFQQLASDIQELCHYLGIQRSIFIGHSMGVNVTLQVAKDFPELVQGMVLISGTFLPVNDIMFDSNIMDFLTPICLKALEKYPQVLKTLWSTSGLNPLIKSIIHNTGFNAKQVSSDFIEIYLNRVGQLGPELFFQLFTEMMKQNITARLTVMNQPALIIGGLKDNVIPNYLQRTLASLMPAAQTYFLPGGSHVPQADFPDLINQRMKLFFEQAIMN
jgi:non-heme chloroperoxidase